MNFNSTLFRITERGAPRNGFISNHEKEHQSLKNVS